MMHPKEFKHEKAGTGRLTHLCLANSELHMGIGFDNDAAVQTLINALVVGAVGVVLGRMTHNLRQELKGDIATIEGKLEGGLAGLRTELKSEIAELRAEIREVRSDLTRVVLAVGAEPRAGRQQS